MQIDQNKLEEYILLTCFKNPAFYNSILDHVKLEYFDNVDVKRILGSTLSFNQEYSKFPNFSELALFSKEKVYKESLKKILIEYKNFQGVDENILIKKTEEFFRNKSVYLTMLDTAKKFADGEISNGEILERFQYCCNISLVNDLGFDYFKNIETHIQYLLTEQEKISTGYKWLDDKLGGGFLSQGKALYVIMGGTNSGKSILLGNLAINVLKQNMCVPIISLEMSEQVYAHRLSAGINNIEVDQLKHQVDHLRSSVENFSKRNPDAKLIIKEFPTGALTIAQLDAYLDKLKKSGYNFNLVFIDYLTLMQAHTGDNSYERGKCLAEGVRALGYKYGFSPVVPVQANREGTDNKMPQLNNASESMAIMHTADFAVSIWEEKEDFETHTKRLGIIKNRFGENNGVKLFEFDTKYLTLKEQDEIFEGETKELEETKINLEVFNEFK